MGATNVRYKKSAKKKKHNNIALSYSFSNRIIEAIPANLIQFTLTNGKNVYKSWNYFLVGAKKDLEMCAKLLHIYEVKKYDCTLKYNLCL